MTILLLIIIFILFYILYIKSKKIKILQNELKEKELDYKNHLTQLENDLKNSSSIRHDLKNHLSSINSLIDSENLIEAKSYIKKLLKTDETSKSILSNNTVIDAILNSKSKEIKKHNINFNLEVNIPNHLSISNSSLTTILTNLLDNAIFASLNTENPYINLILKYNKKNLIISIKNPYSHSVLKKGNEFLSTKSDNKNHGIGLKAIKSCVENLNGRYDIEHNENIFSVFIMIPCN